MWTLLGVLLECKQTLPGLHPNLWLSVKCSHLKSMSTCFKQYNNGQPTYETARDTIKCGLHSQSPEQFLYNTRGTSLAALTSTILTPNNCVAILSPKCINCEYSEPMKNNRLYFVLLEKDKTPRFTAQWLWSLEHETHENVLIFFLHSNSQSVSSLLQIY